MTHICDHCGRKFDYMPFQRDGECLCEECHLEENCQTCPVCENYFEPEEGDEELFFITKKTAEATRRPVGLYRVLKHPFFHGNCVEGFEGFFDGAVEQVNDLDIEDHLDKEHPFYEKHSVATDIICPDCAARYKSIRP